MSNILSEKIIKCTGCGQGLKVPNSALVVAKTVKCPKCGTSLLVNFVDSQTAEPGQPAKDENSNETVYGSGLTNDNSTAWLEFEGMKYYINNPVSVVGRRAGTSTADIQIDTTDMYMGRHHAVITKKTDFSGNTVYTLKRKDAKNGLSVNNIPVAEQEETVLLSGAAIRMGHTVVVFNQ